MKRFRQRHLWLHCTTLETNESNLDSFKKDHLESSRVASNNKTYGCNVENKLCVNYGMLLLYKIDNNCERIGEMTCPLAEVNTDSVEIMQQFHKVINIESNRSFGSNFALHFTHIQQRLGMLGMWTTSSLSAHTGRTKTPATASFTCCRVSSSDSVAVRPLSNSTNSTSWFVVEVINKCFIVDTVTLQHIQLRDLLLRSSTNALLSTQWHQRTWRLLQNYRRCPELWPFSNSPQAGSSILMRRKTTNVKPRLANIHFTTERPHQSVSTHFLFLKIAFKVLFFRMKQRLTMPSHSLKLIGGGGFLCSIRTTRDSTWDTSQNTWISRSFFLKNVVRKKKQRRNTRLKGRTFGGGLKLCLPTFMTCWTFCVNKLLNFVVNKAVWHKRGE